MSWLLRTCFCIKKIINTQFLCQMAVTVNSHRSRRVFGFFFHIYMSKNRVLGVYVTLYDTHKYDGVFLFKFLINLDKPSVLTTARLSEI